MLAELNVKDLWNKYRDMPELNRYLPDRVPKGRQLDRTFFFNILNTVSPETVSKIINHSLSVRNTVESELQKQETIQLTPDWLKLLKETPFKSKTHGKTLFLLKAKSKATAA